MKRVYLIRHGITEANERWLYCGSTDLPLSDAGRAGLERLREFMVYPETAGLRVYTTGLARTEETMQLIWGEVPHTAVPELREMAFGDFEMHSYCDLRETPEYRDWISGDNQKNRCPGGESGEDMTRRVLAAFWQQLLPAGDFLVVTHGGPIAAIMAQLFPKENRSRYDWQPRNGMGYRIDFDGEQPVSWKEIPASRMKLSIIPEEERGEKQHAGFGGI